MPKIKIANPQPGRSKYTSANQAERYVRRGEAVLIGSVLHFLTPEEIRRQRSIERVIASEHHASDVYIRGIVLWNGSDINGMHRPGEVVS